MTIEDTKTTSDLDATVMFVKPKYARYQNMCKRTFLQTNNWLVGPQLSECCNI